jgi:hypothetical protein
MNLHCPLCHGQFSIEALTQDEAARELLGMRATMLPSLLPYLTLFRSEKRALSFDRALKLAKEVMELDADPARLEAALSSTVESLRQKREIGAGKPMKNHNYLKQVLASTPVPVGAALAPHSVQGAPMSKRAQGITALEQWKHD